MEVFGSEKMKSARYGLSRHIQAFFDIELRGIFRFDQAAVAPPEEAPRGELPGMSRPFGKYREIVAIQFGQYDLSVASSNEKPPLGEVMLSCPDGKEFGPLDQVTWQRLGAFIRKQEGKSDGE